MLGMFGVVVVKPAVQAMRAPVVTSQSAEPEPAALQPAPSEDITELVQLIEQDRFDDAGEHWKQWQDAREIAGLSTHEQSIKLGKMMLAKANRDRARDPGLAASLGAQALEMASGARASLLSHGKSTAPADQLVDESKALLRGLGRR